MPQRQPKPIFVPFINNNGLRDITVSNLDEIIFSPGIAGTASSDPNVKQTISNLNEMPFNSSPDLTALDQTMSWVPSVSGHVVKMFLNLCIAAEMPTHTDEDIDIDSITVEITESGSNRVLLLRTYVPGLGQFNAALEERLFLIQESVDNQSIEVSAGVPVEIRIFATITQGSGGTDPTFFMGTSAFFPNTSDTISKMFSTSGIVFYVDRDRAKLG